MNKKVVCFWNAFYIFYFIDISISVPPLYCQQYLNTSDCGGTPTPVFSYYKPGSRCEIEIWRGCATLNKFDDEYQCVHTCIFTFLKSSEESSLEVLMHNESNCDKDLNTTKCTDEIIPVYTYERKKKRCIQADWKGCSTDNKFPDESSCIANCMPNSNEKSFIKKLSHLVPKDANNINSVLNKIIKHDFEELKLTTEFFPEETTDYTSLSDLAKLDDVDTSVENVTVEDKTVTVENNSETLLTTLSTELTTSAEPSTTLTTPTTEATTQITETTISTTTSAPTLIPASAFSSPTSETTSPSTLNSDTTSAPTSETTSASPSAPSTSTTDTTPTTTTIPPSGTVEEVVVPSVDDYDD